MRGLRAGRNRPEGACPNPQLMERPTQPGPVQPDLLPPPDGRMIKPVRAGRKIPRPNPTTLPAQQADLFALPLPPLPRSRFMPDEIRLSIVPSPEKLPADGQDAFLYMVVSQDTAQDLMATGLPLDRRAPLMLTERSGIPPWLAKTADTTMGYGEARPVVLRLKRALVAQALEPDPDHTAEFATVCYLLSGN
ncbi:MAG: hypothetical protein ABF739_09855 [Acetobacter okinawensis]|uniref:hypothetical protein n=2 Tax=Acetobacter okinawensis TaxID=1076594 RepID=UPI002012B780|nr:hypothetical protein [Acetobacter okinawensis]